MNASNFAQALLHPSHSDSTRAIAIARATLREGLAVTPTFEEAQILAREYLRISGLPESWKAS